MQRAPGHGAVPNGWRRVRLGDVAIVNPKRPRLEIDADAPVTFVPMAAVGEDFSGIKDSLSRSYSEVSKGFTYFEEQDLLFSKITPCLQNGKHATARGLINGFGFGSTEFHIVRAADSVNPGFLFRTLTKPEIIKECVNSFTGTAGQQRVQPDTLRSLPILLPPLPEQRAIAAVLDSIDDAIEGAEAVIAATGQLRDSLLHDLLTHGLPGQHTEFREVPGLGAIPAAWQVARLGDVLQAGPTNGIYKPDSEYGSGVCLIRIDDFGFGEFENFGDFKRIQATEEEIRRYEVKEGDIVINRVNSLSHIGKSVLIPEVKEPTLFESNMMRITLSERVDPRYGAMVLLSENARQYFKSRAKKAVQQASINQQDVSQLPFPNPPLAEQQAIAAVLDGVDGAIEQARAERDGLQLLKASTADALLTGRVRVGAAD